MATVRQAGTSSIGSGPGASPAPPGAGKGLKGEAIGLASATVIGVSSVAPAYSLAATLGLIAAIVAVASPAIILVAFVPMLFTASAYYYLNRSDPDCGATFSWVRRAMGPWAGWMGGWGVVVADIVVMPSLAYIAAQYTYLLFGLDSLASNTWAILALGCVFIAVMTLITWMGIELSAKTQMILLSAEIIALAVFSAVVLIKVYASHPAGSVLPSWSWLNPFNLTVHQLTAGVLVTLFIYWGWDTAVNVNEETRDRTRAPGLAAVLSTVILLGTYLIVTFAATAFRGAGFLANNPDDVLTAMGKMAMGTPWDKILVIAVLSSAIACTQTTILPTARTTLSMAANGAMPRSLATIHPKYLTPTWSTFWIGAASILWFVALVLIDRSENILWDSISGLGFAIAFYYGITALAAPVYFRKFLFKSWKNALLMGVAPLLGAATLGWVFVRSAVDYWNPVNSYSPPWFAFGSFHGVGAAFVIGIGMLLLGIPLMLLWWWRHPGYFRQGLEVAETLAPGAAPGSIGGEERVVELPLGPGPRARAGSERGS
jgi:amino acid transporter